MRDQTAEALLTVHEEPLASLQDIVERRATSAAYSDAIRILETVLDLARRGYSTKEDVVRLVSDAKELLELRKHFCHDESVGSRHFIADVQHFD